MGANMARGRMRVVVYDRTPETTQLATRTIGVHAAATAEKLVAGLDAPRMAWLTLRWASVSGGVWGVILNQECPRGNDWEI